jgi:inner membrane protein
MPTVGHLAVGLAAARLRRPPTGFGRWTWTLGLGALALLPDLDVVAFPLGIKYGAPFGHRGALHSLAVALLVGVIIWSAATVLKLPALRAALTGALVVASHGLLDSLTDGGRGIALLWPFSNHRFFAPWRPIPVAPLGVRLFSPAGLSVMIHEVVLFFPVFLIAAWPRRVRPTRPVTGTNATTPASMITMTAASDIDPMSDDRQPIVCRMDALTAAERDRRSQVLELLRGRLLGSAETEDGVAFTLPADPDVPALAGEFIALESRCCAFLRFQLEVGPAGGPVVLRLGGGPGVKEFLTQSFR